MTLLGRLDKSGSIYRVRTYRRMHCSRIVSNARGFPPTILNRSLISPTPVKFHAEFILGYRTRLEINYYLFLNCVGCCCGTPRGCCWVVWAAVVEHHVAVAELCGLLLWNTTWLLLSCVGCCCGAPRGCFRPQPSKINNSLSLRPWMSIHPQC